MAGSQEIAEALAPIGDEALLAGNKAALEAEAARRIGERRLEGVALRLPSRADVDARNVLPGLVVLGQSSTRLNKVSIETNGVIVCTKLGSGETVLQSAFPAPAEKIPFAPNDPKDLPPPPPNPDLEMHVQETTLVDFRARNAVPWRPGRYVVRILISDWRSNAARVTLTGGGSAPPPRVTPGPFPAGTADAVPNFVKSSRSPKLEGVGAALSFADGKALARGAFRMPADPDWGKTQDGRSLVPLTLLFTRAGVVLPLLREIRVPVAAGAEAEGYFEVNVAEEPLPAGAYLVYLVAGEQISEPVPLKL